MPRPLSRTVTLPSPCSSSSMRLAWPGDRLVHGVVEHFGGEMVQRALVGAADIHAGPAPHRLEPFQDLDVLGGIAGRLRLAGEIVEEVGHAIPYEIHHTVATEAVHHNIWSNFVQGASP